MGGKPRAQPRPKGQKFERKVARLIEDDFGPGVKAFRTLQADRAYDSDVAVEGDQLLASIWWECNDERNPNPKGKLTQAKRDCDEALERSGRQRLPIAITHKLSSPTIYVTTYNWVWLSLCAGVMLKIDDSIGNVVVQTTWEEFVLVVWRARSRHIRHLPTGDQIEIHNGSEESPASA